MQQSTYSFQEPGSVVNGRRTAERRSFLAAAWAWIVCPTVFLFSHVPMLNLVARGILIAFLLWFVATAIVGSRRTYFMAPIVGFLIWTFYALFVSILAFDLRLAVSKWVTIFGVGVMALAVLNAVKWSNSIHSWAWAFIVSALLAYVSNYLPIAGYLASNYETDVGGRIVGTLGNANTFGVALVLAFLVGVAVLVFYERGIQSLLAILAMGVFGIGVIESGSRTAMLGLGVSVLALFHSVRARTLFSPVILIMVGGVAAGIFAVISYYPERFAAALGRVEVLLSYIGLAPSVETTEHSLQERADLARIAWRTLLEHPLGIGLDNFREITGTYAHSNFLEVLVSSGFIGFLIYYGGFMWLGIQVIGSRHPQRVVGLRRFLVWALMVVMAMDIANVSYYSKVLWIFIGMICGARLLGEEQAESSALSSRG